MKKLLLLLSALAFTGMHSQSLSLWQAAIADPNKKIQAIHHYPDDIKDGQCHYVEISSIDITDGQITITEDWTDLRGNKAQTVLKGKISGDMATGNWKSTYSSGNWAINLTTGIGKWIKNKAPLQIGTFDSWQKLTFLIVPNRNIKDGFFNCP